MRNRNGFILSCLLAALLSGCDLTPFTPAAPLPAPKPQLGNIVVLDLSSVAKALGEDLIFKEQIERANSSLSQQLTQIAGELNKQLETEKGKLTGDIDAADRQRLAHLTAQAQVELRKKQQEAQRKGQEFQSGLRQQFLEKVRPVAARIARERNASAVSVARSALLWNDPRIDITSDVIAAMQAQTTSKDAAITTDQ